MKVGKELMPELPLHPTSDNPKSLLESKTAPIRKGRRRLRNLLPSEPDESLIRRLL